MGNLGSGLYSLQTEGKEMLVRVEFTLCLAVGGGAEVFSQQNMGGGSFPQWKVHEVLFPVGGRDVGETEIKDVYFQKENLLHIFTSLEPRVNY